jgi:hypothetical protein
MATRYLAVATGDCIESSELIVGSGELGNCLKIGTDGCDKRTREREAEEFPLLEAVTKERLVKTQQAGKVSWCCSEL